MRMTHSALAIPASTITAGVHRLSQKSGGHHQHKPVLSLSARPCFAKHNWRAAALAASCDEKRQGYLQPLLWHQRPQARERNGSPRVILRQIVP